MKIPIYSHIYLKQIQKKANLGAGTAQIATIVAFPTLVLLSIVGSPLTLMITIWPENLSDVQAQTFGAPSAFRPIVGDAAENYNYNYIITIIISFLTLS